jgi:adenylosuccinate lyase
MTFGLKMAVFGLEAQRHLERLRECRKRVVVGKMAGAVGTAAGLGPKALEVQEHVGRALGLPMEEGATQIVQRDRLNELLGHLANLAASLEKFATEVRNLQRTEIDEVAEGFVAESQVGSSTMAQKQNPVACEKVSGLARIARAFLAPAYENAVQWHERDLSNSSGERFILPHLFLLTHECAATMADVFRDLRVHPDRMRENLLRTPTITAEAVVIGLTERGLGRQDAHEIVRKAALNARSREGFRDALLAERRVSQIVKHAELEKWLDPFHYVGKAPELVDRVLRLTGRGP